MPILCRSQEQYELAVHYLNWLMMNEQRHMLHKDRIRLLRNEGTNDGSYEKVNYNKSEINYALKNRNAVSLYDIRQKGKKEATKRDEYYMRRRMDDIKRGWVRGLEEKETTGNVQLKLISVDTEEDSEYIGVWNVRKRNEGRKFDFEECESKFSLSLIHI